MIRVREATEADAAAILQIYNHEIENGVATWDYEPGTLEARIEWLRAHTPPYCALVAEDETDAVVGFASLSIYRPRPGYRFTAESSVYVRPERQRRGVGTALMADLLPRAKTNGFHTVLALIEAGNAASIQLHRNFGFEIAGHHREVGYKFERWLDLITMQLMLR